MFLVWDHVPDLWPTSGLLFIPQTIHEYGEPRWNDIGRGNIRTPSETCRSANLSITNPTWTDPGENLRCARLATDHLSYGTALTAYLSPKDTADFTPRQRTDPATFGLSFLETSNMRAVTQSWSVSKSFTGLCGLQLLKGFLRDQYVP
jgi:hypothetical protein